MSYISTHCHTRIGSTRDALAHIDDMCKIAAENKMTWSITDHGVIAGWMDYWKSCQQHGIKPVFGCELYVNAQLERLFELRTKLASLKNISTKNMSQTERENLRNEIRASTIEFDEIKKYRHLLVMATSTHGFYNLMTLHNKAFSDGFYGKPTATYKWLFDLPKDKKGDRGLVVTSACLGSESSQFIMNEKNHAAYDWLGLMHEELPGKFFVELQPNGLELQRHVNKTHIEMARKLKIPLSLGTDSHYVGHNDSAMHETFLLIQGKSKISDVGKKVWRIKYENKKGERMRRKVEPGALFNDKPIEEIQIGDVLKGNTIIAKEEVDKVWTMESELDLTFKTEEQIRQSIINDHPEIKNVMEEAISGNYAIDEMIETIDIDSDLKLPRFKDAFNQLKRLCARGLIEKQLHDKPEYMQRLKYEFKVIRSGDNLDGYFLLLYEIINFAKEKKIPIGPGRGSSGSSLVCYLLGITRMDPLEWNFPFERFLNPERVARSVILTIETDNGDYTYAENDIVNIIRNGERISVKAIDLTEQDEIVI